MRVQPIAHLYVPMRQRVRAGAWIGLVVLLFCAATALTIAICMSMSSKGGTPMPGGWTMSMAWGRLCGQTWPGAAASFIGMWASMTVAMMLPALMPTLLPVLWRGGIAAAGRGTVRTESFVLLAGSCYFVVWIALGVALYPVGAALAELTLRSPAVARAVPFAAGGIVLLAGAFQLSAAKARLLACCRAAAVPGLAQRVSLRAAWRDGVRLGWHCVGCCAGLMAMVLVAGVMDLRAMALAAAAIAGERLARNGDRVARIVGGVLVVAGGVLLAKASGVG